MKITLYKTLHLVAFTCAAILFFLASNRSVPEFREVASITWNNNQGCSIHKTVSERKTICVSSPFRTTTNNLELPIRSDQAVTFRVESIDSDWHEDIEIPATIVNNKDRGYFFDSQITPQKLSGDLIRVVIIANHSSLANFEAQNQISFLQNVSSGSSKHNNSNPYRFVAVFMLAATFILIAVHFPSIVKNNAAFLTALCIAGFVVHYRANLFYNWDEWVILDRFLNNGFSEALRRHNEHFLPLYFGIYFSEVNFFLKLYDGLILFSLLILVINSWLVSKILALLSPFSHLPSAVYLILYIMKECNGR